MADILKKIVEKKREEIAAAKLVCGIEQIQEQAKVAAPARDFLRALAGHSEIRLIAEVKKASPSKGIIRADFDPVVIAQTYEANGAACASILTDESFFAGSLEYLRQIRQKVQIPLLRKDFILDPYQVYEARAAGADAVLLIAECLSASELKELNELIVSLGMVALIELYDEANLRAVLDSGTRLVGVNNRNLRDFQVDLNHTIRMRKLMPAGITLVGESGIATRDDALLLQNAGVNAMLVGESLMRQPDIGQAVRNLLGR